MRNKIMTENKMHTWDMKRETEGTWQFHFFKDKLKRIVVIVKEKKSIYNIGYMKEKELIGTYILIVLCSVFHCTFSKAASETRCPPSVSNSGAM